MMRFETLDDWLDWQQQLNPKTIDLGLQRVSEVYHRLQLKPLKKVITVAGTNGKGSTVAGYERWLKNAGYSVASYTSPHILHYNERIKLNLQAVTDAQLCLAFDAIDRVREDIQLTYFEFGTLAALVLMDEIEPDYAILEVGLGGRLDAVNIIDADLAHITPIGLDHQSWLGNDRETIGIEKAGILRKNCLVVCSDDDPPDSVIQRIQDHQCRTAILNREYQYHWIDDRSIQWSGHDNELQLTPPLPGVHQAQNISGVLAGLELLDCLQGLDNQTIAAYFDGMECIGRLQTLSSERFSARLMVDVGHNQQAAQVIAYYLNNLKPRQRVVVLLGMLEDKDCSAYVSELMSVVDEWWLVSLSGERGLDASQLQQRVSSVIQQSKLFDSVDQALSDAMSSLGNQDIILATGSFVTVEAVYNFLGPVNTN